MSIDIALHARKQNGVVRIRKNKNECYSNESYSEYLEQL